MGTAAGSLGTKTQAASPSERPSGFEALIGKVSAELRNLQASVHGLTDFITLIPPFFAVF